MDWVRVLAYVTGTVDQELLARNQYLAAENRILKAQLRARLKLSDVERAMLGEIGHRLGRKTRADVATVAKPDTILSWYRKRVARSITRSCPHAPPKIRDSARQRYQMLTRPGTRFSQNISILRSDFKADFGKPDTNMGELLGGEADEGSHLNSCCSRHAVRALRTRWRHSKSHAGQTQPRASRPDSEAERVKTRATALAFLRLYSFAASPSG
jgi:hypothetical protein